jgi:hypothetical protein
MPSSTTMTNIAEAFQKLNEAGEGLLNAVKATYPVGSRLYITMGRARILVEVTGHRSTPCYRPADVFVRNVKTGTHRKFSATYGGHAPEKC